MTMKKFIAIYLMSLVGMICYCQEDLGAKYTDNPNAALYDSEFCNYLY